MERRSYLWVWVILAILVFAIAGYFAWKTVFSEKLAGKTSTGSSKTAEKTTWQEKGVAISGQYADADVVDMGSGKYRMYYSTEPEVQGNNLEVYSATSSDGITWTKEDGIRKTMATFPDVIKLPDGKWRMYFQNAGAIKSATSTDGLSWTDEPGTRVDKNEAGYNLENVGAQSTTILSDGSYIMAYRGTINETYKTADKVPNKDTHIYFWATSADGLTFEKKGLSIDSRNEILLGAADGADWVDFDGETRVYFWSYTGVYHTVYSSGSFSSPVFDFTNNKNSQVKFAENPPGDPTLIKISNVWYMYYGQHTKGVYYATLEN